MNYKNIISDSGNYVNGIYQTKNGYSGSGTNCARGVNMFDTSVIPVIFFEPEDKLEGEEFEAISPDVVQNICPYYAISNYGRIYNFRTKLFMKQNTRPNGYKYCTFSTTDHNDDGRIKKRKGTTHRLIMETFEPQENYKKLEVNHIDGNKDNNTYNVHLDDGTILNNLEWVTPSENIKHAIKTGLVPHYKNDKESNRHRSLTMDEARDIRKMHEEGYSIKQINKKYPIVSSSTIQNIYTGRNYKEK